MQQNFGDRFSTNFPIYCFEIKVICTFTYDVSTYTLCHFLIPHNVPNRMSHNMLPPPVKLMSLTEWSWNKFVTLKLWKCPTFDLYGRGQFWLEFSSYFRTYRLFSTGLFLQKFRVFKPVFCWSSFGFGRPESSKDRETETAEIFYPSHCIISN